MKILTQVIIMGLMFLMPLYTNSAAASSDKPKVSVKNGIPKYKPPLRGAPVGRIGGGTRGSSDRESFTLQVLAPNHIGNTTKEQPCLYWYISNPTNHPVELTITERKQIKPLLEKTLAIPKQGGIESVCLGDYGVKLHKNIPYRWFVTLVIDPNHRSKDILAGGMLTVVNPSPVLTEKLKSQDKEKMLNAYAEEGFWYDAIDTVSKMITTSPNNSRLHKWRASLLEQVGLVEIATHESDEIK